jgi:hypothetical protein
VLESFAEVLGKLFPAIDPEARRKFIEALREGRPISKELYAPSLPSGICQGDLIDRICIHSLEDDGEWYEFEGLGLVLSNTCDAATESDITLAACYEYSDFASDPELSKNKGFMASIHGNEVSRFLFLPGVPRLGDVIVDLGLIGSVSRIWLQDQLEEHGRFRLATLSPLGYYLLISKLTVHLLRPETNEIERTTAIPRFRDRVIEAFQILQGRRR